MVQTSDPLNFGFEFASARGFILRYLLLIWSYLNIKTVNSGFWEFTLSPGPPIILIVAGELGECRTLAANGEMRETSNESLYQLERLTK